MVTESAGGDYELELEHPLDDQLRCDMLVEERLIKAPVPAVTIPQTQLPDLQGWKVTTATDLYSKTPTVTLKTKNWAVILINIVFSFIMVFTLFMFQRKVLSHPFKRKRDELVANIIGSLVIGLAISTLITLVQHLVWAPPAAARHHTLFHTICRSWLGDLPLIILPVLISYLMRSMHLEKIAAIENEMLRAENLNSRYEALKNQLDPHFLFNSLNTLKSLIDVDVDKAEEFTQRLSSVLRYTLQNKEIVTLAEELDCVRSYCIMMKMRYGDNLQFDHHIDHDKYDNYYVLPLSIQGLMENAIKHNVISSRLPLTVYIMTDDDNHLIISNKIHLKIGKEEGSGIGLANLAERYRIKWNENVDIFDDGKIFSVTLPLKQNE